MQRCKRLKYLKVWYGTGLFWVTIVIYLSTTPSPPETSGIQYGDKIFHTLGYFCLFYWFAQIYRNTHLWRPAVALIFMGITLEFVQSTLGYRSFELADMLANTAGVLLGWFIANFVYASLFETVEKKLFSFA